MNRDEHLHLLAERTELQRILAGIPEADILTRSSFAARLEDVEEQLGRATSDSREASLLTDGVPGVAGRGAPDPGTAAGSTAASGNQI